jgi:hypothetical protein
VGWSAVGVKQLGGPLETGPAASQQSAPGAQQALPQQNELGAQSSTVGPHVAWTQWPLLQRLVIPVQRVPQLPQFIGSLAGFTQAPWQHMAPVVHATMHGAPAPAPPLSVAPSTGGPLTEPHPSARRNRAARDATR